MPADTDLAIPDLPASQEGIDRLRELLLALGEGPFRLQQALEAARVDEELLSAALRDLLGAELPVFGNLFFLADGLLDPDEVPDVVETLRDVPATLAAAREQVLEALEPAARRRVCELEPAVRVEEEDLLARANVLGAFLLAKAGLGPDRRPRSDPAHGAPEPGALGEERGDPISILEMPFRELVEADTELAEARQRYAAAEPKERRLVAIDVYHRGEADQVWTAVVEDEASEADPWRAEVCALAVDPDYAPAILTVGTLEYEIGRREEALELLGRLPTLPADTEDLAGIIDKAAGYLLEQDDPEAARDLYAAAESRFPEAWRRCRRCGRSPRS